MITTTQELDKINAAMQAEAFAAARKIISHVRQDFDRTGLRTVITHSTYVGGECVSIENNGELCGAH